MDPRPSYLARTWASVRRRSGVILIAGLVVIAVALGLALWSDFGTGEAPTQSVDTNAIIDEVLGAVADAPAVSSQVYQAILPSLVVVQSNAIDEDGELGLGTGVVINAEAHVLTALHVVDGATEIRLSFADGTRTFGGIVAIDPERDIAVLVPAIAPGLVVPATIGNSSGVGVGDEVYAVGNPLGLVGSMSAGVVSGLNRQFHPTGGDTVLQGVIQFDAAVNRGSSGGPLLDRRGQVVGIVTGLINPSEADTFIGIGFAVPIEAAAGAAGRPAQ